MQASPKVWSPEPQRGSGMQPKGVEPWARAPLGNGETGSFFGFHGPQRGPVTRIRLRKATHLPEPPSRFLIREEGG